MNAPRKPRNGVQTGRCSPRIYFTVLDEAFVQATHQAEMEATARQQERQFDEQQSALMAAQQSQNAQIDSIYQNGTDGKDQTGGSSNEEEKDAQNNQQQYSQE
jgi:hypothetical protein